MTVYVIDCKTCGRLARVEATAAPTACPSCGTSISGTSVTKYFCDKHVPSGTRSNEVMIAYEPDDSGTNTCDTCGATATWVVTITKI